MRKLRPENYSDTQDRSKIVLTADQLEYHLETITARNQTHDFELFCRKLCERAICPNLRAQTGPEGGGDSMVDTESLPVSKEVLDLYYEGLDNSGTERWAFAISAKKKWTEKARHDVQNIAESGRGYERIFFVTSRHARAKDRARLEDELSKAHGIPITIHDRTWIVDEVIEKDRIDLAHNFLGIGQAVQGGARLGPNDYSRAQQLEDIENEVRNPENFVGMESQLASEVLAAAKISRNLERPRVETDGRFLRAIRLADKNGISRQKLEARYEHIWTAFWWFDDFDFLLSEYDAFEERALQSDSAGDLEWLGNLHQLLVNGVTHDHISIEDAKLVERADRLEAKLQTMATEPERPNNRLEARAAILRVRLNRAIVHEEHVALPEIWKEYADVVEAAQGLGEFNFDSLIDFIEVVGQFAGNDPAYNALVEKTAELVAERRSESEAALVYLKRAQKLDFEDNFDMIRWLGKAAVGLSKKEYSDELVEATQLLALAYRSAGLLWAARASCAMATATMFIEGERTNEVPVGVVPTMKMWTWISLELWHLPDFLMNVQLLNGFLAGLPLDDESKERVKADLQELDLALGSLILNLNDSDLKRLERLPDTLQGLGLYMARMALLYMLGHLNTLRADGSIPAEEKDEEIADLMGQLKSQSVNESVDAPLVLNENGAKSLTSFILGMRVTVEYEGAELTSVAETVLGTLEAFFATAIEQQIAPHAEAYRIVLSKSDHIREPEISTDEFDMTTRIVWPHDLYSGDYDREGEVRSHLTVMAGHVLITGCSTPDSEGLIERLFRDEAVTHRIATISIFPNSYSRITGKPFSCLNDWDKYNPKPYKIQLPRPVLTPKPTSVQSDERAPSENLGLSLPKNHKSLGVRSVIDVRTWDKAVWRGCGYLQMDHDSPPILALLFEDAQAARKIFERWRERFGDQDKEDEIAISIIRNLPQWHSAHYIVQITSSFLPEVSKTTPKVFSIPVRSLEMEPTSSDNLERFLAGYRKFSAYAIMPGIVRTDPSAQPELDFNSAIEKRALSVIDAADVDEHSPEAIALNIRGINVTN